ncbi:MAG: EAL domain-containing protein [Pseudomonadota bacterium]
MFEGTNYHGETARGLSERLRRIAFWIGTLGLSINVFVGVVYMVTGQGNLAMISEVIVYGALLGTITLSALRNAHVKRVLFGCLLAIFAVFWISNFAEGLTGLAKVIDMPLVLFIPLFVVLILEHRLLFALAPVQAICVFIYVFNFTMVDLGGSWAESNGFMFSLLLAIFSGCSFALLGVIAYARDQADQKLYEVILEKEQLADTDDLTGLMNRRAFMDQLRALWSKRSKIGIAFVDLDHFKPLNDQYGHAVGDQVLTKIAVRIRQSPHVVSCARLGGDEFAVLFDEASCEAAVQEQIEALHARITQDIRWESGLIMIGASIGYADGRTQRQSLSGLLRAADTAMRRAKGSGLAWAKFSPLIDNAAIASSTLELELKSAIGSGQIRAAVQPIADAKSLDIVAYELLTRWTNSGFERDPSPADFIPIAEKLGLLNEILWVTLDEALSHLDLSHCKLAINASPAQLVASDFIDSLVRILERHDVRPHSITIEITEEVAFRNVDRNVAILKQARELGFEIALDDFGTGYSSLAMLDTLPLDKLKIDQSFVRKSDKSTQSKSILLVAIRLARQLGLESCVEGIETEEAARRIAVLGADTIQGYWLGKPRLVQDGPRPLKLVS